MTDQSIPQFIDDDRPAPVARPAIRGSAPTAEVAAPPAERRLTFLRTLDKPLLVIVGMLLMTGVVMVFSSTFDWSLVEFGSETAVLVQHGRNLIIGLTVMAIFSALDVRIVKRLAVMIMLLAISFLIAVLIFGDDTFGARRALIDGRFQPGEFSELAIIIYMSAWLSSKQRRVSSFTAGLLPFVMLVTVVIALVVLQPDFSTALVILISTSVMFFMAGADMRQVAAILVILAVAWFVSRPFMPAYVTDRLDRFESSLNITDPMMVDYHTRQALIAFFSGGWTGVGLGESRQKFLALPAAHTDSIFAVIGEELGVVGASGVVLLYVALVMRGLQIAWNAGDSFRMLLAAGVTVWLATKAMLNIAVIIALIPFTGLPLPFISYGGSSLVVLMVGVGLLLSVQRDTVIRKNTPERRKPLAHHDNGGRDRRARVSRAGYSGGDG